MRLLIVPIVLAGAAFWISSTQRGIELEIEKDRQQEAALQEYLDGMTELLLDKGLRNSEEGAQVRAVARARTLTVVRGLDGKRKGLLLRFLSELDLIRDEAIISLGEADLRDADLRGADLSFTDLSRADLSDADLSGANLTWAKLYGADLSGAYLRGANLTGADLFNADLSGADLRDAELRDAELSRAKVTDEQLASATSLKGAIMPDGTEHE
jgi:uncharacterized protein YjbI with pentapeptide repeats